MDELNEGDNASLTINWFDSSGVAAAPLSASYRIDDVNSGQAIRAETNLAATASVTIELTHDDNAILDDDNPHEGRRLTATAVYGTDAAGKPKQKTAVYEWQVKNLRFEN